MGVGVRAGERSRIGWWGWGEVEAEGHRLMRFWKKEPGLGSVGEIS